jgi:hypothetical protein
MVQNRPLAANTNNVSEGQPDTWGVSSTQGTYRSLGSSVHETGSTPNNVGLTSLAVSPYSTT